MAEKRVLLLLTVHQACERLNISRTTLYELMNAGELESVSIGRARRIPVSSVNDFIDKRIASTRGGAA